MRRSSRWRGARAARLLGVAVLLTALVGSAAARPVAADHETRDGMFAETHYISVQFLFQFRWDDPWEADLDEVESIDGEYDRIVVEGPDGIVEAVLSYDDDVEEILEDVIAEREDAAPDLEIVGEDAGEGGDFGGPYSSATLAYEGEGPDGDDADLIEYVEVSSVNATEDGEGVLVARLAAPAETFEDVFEDVQETFIRDEGFFGLFFVGEPAVGGQAQDDDDAEDADDDRGRDDEEDEQDQDQEEDEDRTQDDEDEDDRTRDDEGEDQDEDEDEDRTRDDEDEDEDARSSAGEYTSPTFDFTLAYDEDVWTVGEESSEDDVDILQLDSDVSGVTFTAFEAYDGDAEACLDGRIEVLEDDDFFEEIEEIEEADGDDELASAVYLVVFENDAGDEVEAQIYLECRTIVEGEAVLDVFFFSNPSDFDDELALLEDILDSIEVAE